MADSHRIFGFTDEQLATMELSWRPGLFEGQVVLEAVIDTTGHAEPNSIKVISSTNRAFEAPAKDAMRRALFRPGRVRGQAVRVLVHLPIRFTIPK